MSNNQPVAARISSLDQEISTLTANLRRCDEDAALRCLETLLTAGFAFPSAIDPARGPKVYSFALTGIPSAGVKRATERLIRGEYSRSDHGFLPKPPEFAEMARCEARVMADELRRARDTRSTLTDLAVQLRQPTEEQKVRVRLLVERTKRALTSSEDISGWHDV